MTFLTNDVSKYSLVGGFNGRTMKWFKVKHIYKLTKLTLHKYFHNRALKKKGEEVDQILLSFKACCTLLTMRCKSSKINQPKIENANK